MSGRPCKRSNDGKKPPRKRPGSSAGGSVTFGSVSCLPSSSPEGFAAARKRLVDLGLIAAAAATQPKHDEDGSVAAGSVAAGWNEGPEELTPEELAGFVRQPSPLDTFEDAHHFACKQTVASVVSALLSALDRMDCSYYVVKDVRGEILVNACVARTERVAVSVRLYNEPPTALAAGGSNGLIVACQRRSGDELAAWRIFHELRNKSGLAGPVQPLPPLLRKPLCALCEPGSDSESDGEDNKPNAGPPEIYMQMLESLFDDEVLAGAKRLAECTCHGPLDTASAEPSVCLAPASYAPALPRLLASLLRTKTMIGAQRAQLSHSEDWLDQIRQTFVCIGKTIGDVVAAAQAAAQASPQASPKGLADDVIAQVVRDAVGPLAAYCSEPDKDVEGARILLKSLAQLVAAHPILREEALPGLESALAICDGNPFLKKTVGLVRQYLAGLAQ